MSKTTLPTFAPGIVLRKQLAFFKRGFAIDASYKLTFLLGLVEAVSPLFVFHFLARLIDPADSRFKNYGGGYFGFVCVGIALSQYFSKALSSCGTSIRRAQMSGVLEATLSTQTSATAVLLYDALYQFAGALTQMLVLLTASVVFFGLDLSRTNWMVALLALVFASLVFLALSVLSAAVIIRTQSRDPVQFLLGGLGSLLAGAYFPVSLLPEWLQSLAQAIPMTHALESLRAALLAGADLATVQRPLVILAAMCAVLLPLGLVIFSRSVEGARRDGSLFQY